MMIKTHIHYIYNMWKTWAAMDAGRSGGCLPIPVTPELVWLRPGPGEGLLRSQKTVDGSGVMRRVANSSGTGYLDRLPGC